jgi:hypothetical protein
MEAKKIATITADASGGLIVTLVGFKMATFPYDIVWGIFNFWLWIVSPALILWARNKEDAKNL